MAKPVVAKGKKKRQELEAEKELEENIVVPMKDADQIHHVKKSEVRSQEITNIMADEIELLYHDYKAELDRPNAEDKALNILRHLRYKTGVKFSEVR